MECMCNDCVKSTFNNVIEYLKYKNGELNEILKSLKEDRGYRPSPIEDDDVMIKFTKDEIKDILEMISDMKTIKNQIPN